MFAIALGEEIRRRRLALGLTQADLGAPLSRAFVSRVEHGRLTPSLPSLLLLADRLGSTGAALLATVETGPASTTERAGRRPPDSTEIHLGPTAGDGPFDAGVRDDPGDGHGPEDRDGDPGRHERHRDRDRIEDR